MPTSKKIVILEDDRSSAKLIAHFLEKSGYAVIQTREGGDAIEVTLKEKPYLVVVDILLPDMNGSEVVKQLVASTALPDLKVLFLTSLLGKLAQPGQETSLKVGNREFPGLSKPFRPDSLLEIVTRMIGPPIIEEEVEPEDEEETEDGEESEIESSGDEEDAPVSKEV